MPHALPGSSYAASYSAQLERVLAPGWHVLDDRFALGDARATPLTLLPGSLDEPVLLTRAEGERPRLFSNVCTHRGARLLDAPCAAASLRCPYHGRRFGLDGAVLAAPGFAQVPDEPLSSLSLATWGPLWLASLSPEARPSALDELAPRLGFLDFDALRPDPTATRAYSIDAHWLLWCENYLEGMHIPYVHPRLARALDLGRYSIETFAQTALQIGEAASDEPCFALPAGHPDEGRRVGGYYVFLYPTTALNVYPWGLSLNLVRPEGPRRTRVEYRAYVWQDALRERGAGAGLDQVEREDDAIVERAQQGVASRRYRPGALSPAHEPALAWLHARLARDLEG